MSFERPSKGLLVFQCDVCIDERYELSAADGDPVGDGKACWAVLHAEGWTIQKSEHLCPDCSKTAKADRDNPFRR